MALAKKAGVQIMPVDFVGADETKSGYIKKDENDKPIICFNAAQAAVRQRFTIAHELGHFFLGHLDMQSLFVTDDEQLEAGGIIYRSGNSYIDFRNPTPEEVCEIEANRFASCLLMPKHLVEKYWEVKPDVGFLAQSFHVSIDAMRIRLKTLKLLLD
jgi:Zn-dependent peptidase ImmA (M78 family)